MRLFQIILLFVLMYYLVSKYVFPFLLKIFIHKTQEHFQQFYQGDQTQSPRKEGEINVDYNPMSGKKSDFNPREIEDIDFEEIKDK